MLFTELEQDVQDNLYEEYLEQHLLDLINSDIKYTLETRLGVHVYYASIDETSYGDIVLDDLEVFPEHFAAWMRARNYPAHVVDAFTRCCPQAHAMIECGRTTGYEQLLELEHYFTTPDYVEALLTAQTAFYLEGQRIVRDIENQIRYGIREMLECDTDTDYNPDGSWAGC